MIGSLGTDEFGQQALKSLEAEDISLEHVQQCEDSSTGMALVTVDANSENTIVVISGCNMELSADDVTAPEIGADDFAVSQFEIPRSTVDAFFQAATDNGATTVLNPAPAEELAESTAALVDYLIVNETEALTYSGLNGEPPLSRDVVIEACRELRTHEDQTIIVTLGADGLLASTSSEILTLETYAVDAVDTTGAGDAFVGAFVSALNNGAPLKQALDFANAAGAVATTAEGASTAVPTPTEVENLRN
jgi:ribokinase